MQKQTANYNQFTLWSLIVLIIVAPAYVTFDLSFRQSYEAEKIHDEYIKKGSFLYAEFCKGCHGMQGGGINEDPKYVGLPLSKTADMKARDSKDPFIVKTVSRGRRGTQMPPWLKEEGGPLDIEDVKMLRAFILDGTHWGQYFDYTSHTHKTWFPTTEFDKNQLAKLPPPPNPEAAGKQFFNVGPCATCHNVTAEVKVGPGLAGLFASGKKLPNGKDVTEDNLKEWINKGSAATYAVPAGKVPMPPYPDIQGKTMDDLLAYLKTLK
jgi:mono/diheme cytochrome c family protein